MRNRQNSLPPYEKKRPPRSGKRQTDRLQQRAYRESRRAKTPEAAPAPAAPQRPEREPAVLVTFHNISFSAAVEEMIRHEARKLLTFHPRLLSCRVVVDAPHRRHLRGFRWEIRLDLAVPGGEIAVSHLPGHPLGTKDPEVPRDKKSIETGEERKRIQTAVREAFQSARRILQDFARRQRGAVKRHTLAGPRNS